MIMAFRTTKIAARVLRPATGQKPGFPDLSSGRPLLPVRSGWQGLQCLHAIPPCFRRHDRAAFTLVELVCVLGLVGVLIGLFLPAVQQVRESARQTACLNNLRQISLAVQGFESARMRLPPGTLGFDLTYPVAGIPGFPDSTWFQPTHDLYWKRRQHCSALTQCLSWLEQANLADQLPAAAFDFSGGWGPYPPGQTGPPEWIGTEPAVAEAMRTWVSVFLCPSDDLERESGSVALVTSQPCWDTTGGMDLMIGEPSLWEIFQPAGTNYLGCVGAHSGGREVSPEMYGFRGAMTCRERLATSQIEDGSSNTILFGESIGAIAARNRTMHTSWMFAGLARGRGILPWRSDVLPSAPEYLLLGDSEYSYPVGFGSRHPHVVNFAFADGSVHEISRRIQLDAFYALCGAFDGEFAGDQW